MEAFDDLREHIDEWIKQERADGERVPDFWDECDTTASLARALADCGFSRFNGSQKVAVPLTANKECPHNQLQKSRERYTENVYVCGNCSALFIVSPKLADSPVNQPMFDTRKPWGTRSRQA